MNEPLSLLPGAPTDLGTLTARRLLPRRERRTVGPFCFLDSYGPLAFTSGKPMDIAPHPHIGLQTVTWLLAGEVFHRDSLGSEAFARPGVLSLMTAGRGIAHSEETPEVHAGRLRGVQLWVALPDAHRWDDPRFERHDRLPSIDLGAGRATVILGELAGAASPARVYSPLIAAELALEPGAAVTVALEPRFEHALALLTGQASVAGERLPIDTLAVLGSDRASVAIESGAEASRLLLVGGAPFTEPLVMWWNFVARSHGEVAEARADWEAGRRFGEVLGYAGERLAAPALVARPVPHG